MQTSLLKNSHLPIRSSTHQRGYLSNPKRYIEVSRMNQPIGSLELALISAFRCWFKEAPQAECRKVWSLGLWVIRDIFPETLDQKGEIRFHRSTCVRLSKQLTKRLASHHKALKAFQFTCVLIYSKERNITRKNLKPNLLRQILARVGPHANAKTSTRQTQETSSNGNAPFWTKVG